MGSSDGQGKSTQYLRGLSKRLEDLGGGSALLGHAHVAARVCHPAARPTKGAEIGKRGIITCGTNGQVIAADPHANPDTPADQATRKFTLSHAISEHYGTKWCYEDEGSTGRELLRWVLTGFSAVLILLGQTATGKTHTVFERGTGVKELQMPWEDCDESLLDWLLQQIFDQLEEEKPSNGAYYVGLSMWEITAENKLVDLLATRAKYYMSIFEPTCVEAQNVDEARQILVHGRQASRNWEAIDNMEARPRLNRSHSLVRISLWRQREGQYCELNVVDTVGSQSLSSRAHCPSKEGPDEAEKRQCSSHLFALSRTLSELARSDNSSKADGKLFSCRDSRLSQILGPMLAKGSRPFFLCTLSPFATDFLETLNTLRIASKAKQIATPCTRTTGMSARELKWERLSNLCRREHLRSERAVKRCNVSARKRVQKSNVLSHEDIVDEGPRISDNFDDAAKPGGEARGGKREEPIDEDGETPVSWNSILDRVKSRKQMAIAASHRDEQSAPEGAGTQEKSGNHHWQEGCSTDNGEDFDKWLRSHDRYSEATQYPEKDEGDPEDLHAKLQSLKREIHGDVKKEPAYEEDESDFVRDSRNALGKDFEERHKMLFDRLKVMEKACQEKDEKIRQLERDFLELQSCHEMEIEKRNSRENSLLNKCKALEGGHDLQEIFQTYEKEVSDLATEKNELEKQNENLRAQMARSQSGQVEDGKNAKGEDSRKIINRLQREKDNLNKRIDELKGGERLTAIAKRQTAKDQSRAQEAERKAKAGEKAVREKEAETNQLRADLEKAREEAKRNAEKLEKVSAQRDRLEAEVSQLRGETNKRRHHFRQHGNAPLSRDGAKGNQGASGRIQKAVTAAKQLQKLIDKQTPKVERTLERLVKDVQSLANEESGRT